MVYHIHDEAIAISIEVTQRRGFRVRESERHLNDTCRRPGR